MVAALGSALVAGVLVTVHALTGYLEVSFDRRVHILGVAALTLVLVGVALTGSGGLLSVAARLATKCEHTGVAQWIAHTMLRHPSVALRLSGHLILLDLRSRVDHGGAADVARALVECVRSGSRCSWAHVNRAIDRLVSHGCYLEAIELAEAGARGTELSLKGFHHGLAQVNRAEALHNLGRDDEAMAVLDGVLDRADAIPFVRDGALCMKAWILAARKDATALQLIGRVESGSMGTAYESELYFTRAAALAAVERFDDAMTEAHAGLEKAVRPSSTRNGWFLLGSIAADAGRCERALEYFDRGLDLRYRGQGGFALLRRARVIAQLGRGDVLDALSLVIERDPQSQAARDASRELQTRRKSDPSSGN